MLFAFDLDGTLFDTRVAVQAAYEAVGIDMPKDAFGKSWCEWLPALCVDSTYIHTQKNVVYKSLVEKGFVKPLPLFNLYREVYRKSMIVTGASMTAAEALLAPYKLSVPTVLAEYSRGMKIDWMNRIGIGIMFEDDLEAATRMRKETKWTIFHSPQ